MEHSLTEISHKLDLILQKLDGQADILQRQKETQEKLSEHIDFVESVYDSMRSTLSRFYLFPPIPKKVKNE